MTDINLKTLTPDTSLPTTGYLFGADSQSVSTPSVYSTQTVATTLLGSTSLTGDTLTASAPVLNLAQTWNNGAVTFKGVVVNATDTASAAASLLMDLQIAGTSKFSVKKDGSVSTGVWQGTAVGVAYGGTGQTTASAGFNALSPVTSTGDLIVGNGTNSSTRLGIGSTGQVLTVSGGTATWAAAAAGSGTVTSVSVTTANGVSGTVATATTTPAISLSLGDITPTKVTISEVVGSSALVLTGATQTASFPVLDATQTWNNAATTFTAVKLNVTSTASAAASLLMDFQVGGSAVLRVGKDGSITNPTYAGNLSWRNGDMVMSSNLNFIWSSGGFVSGSGGLFAFKDNAGINATTDLLLTRRAAANLRFGAADAASPVAQTLSVQSVVAGTSNTAGANFTFTGSQGTGTGAGGSIVFQVAPAGSTGTAQNALTPVLTLNGNLVSGNTLVTLSGTLAVADSGIEFSLGTGKQIFGASGMVVIASSSNQGFAISNADTRLHRDAANTVAQRNGTAAQALNIYNTYTSSTSFERYSIDWITTANLAIVGPNKGSGGGTQRVQRLSYLEDGGAGSTVPLLGSTCPAASGTVKSWIKIITSDGTTAYIPCWA